MNPRVFEIMLLIMYHEKSSENAKKNKANCTDWRASNRNRLYVSRIAFGVDEQTDLYLRPPGFL